MNRRVVLLDGGMGQELVWRSAKPPSPIWSAMVMLERPDLVRALHREFIEAGARVITLNAYAATRARLARVGLEDRLVSLQRRACSLALEAREQAGVEGVRIAGCLSPLVFSYRPELAGDFNQMRAAYDEIVALQAPHVDLFLCETMSTAEEARAAASAACAAGKPVWLGWTLADEANGKLRDGGSLTQAAAALEGLAVQALLVNCAPPESVDAAMPELSRLGRPFGAYANGFAPIPDDYRTGATVAVLDRREDLDPATYAGFAMGWVEAGAAIVGGCCEVGPSHIGLLAERLTEASYAITGDLT